MTAKDVLYKILGSLKEDSLQEYLEDNPEELEHILDIIRGFTELHVGKALDTASKLDFEDITHPKANDYEEAVELTIKECYPLDNIK